MTLHGVGVARQHVGRVGWLRQTSPNVFAAEQTFSVDDFSQNYDAHGARGRRLRRRRRARRARRDAGSVCRCSSRTPAILPTLGPAWIVDAQPSSNATNVASRGAADTDARARRDERRSARPCSCATRAATWSRPTSPTTPGARTITITPNAPLANGQYSVHVERPDGRHRDAGRRRDHLHRRSARRRDRAADHAALTAVGDPQHRGGDALVHGERSGRDLLCSYDNAAVSPLHLAATRHRHSGRALVPRVRPRPRRERGPDPGRRDVDLPAAGARLLDARAARARSIAFGTAPGLGNASTSTAVDFDVSPTGYGYWIVDASGHVFAFGDARAHGNAPALARRRFGDEHQPDRERQRLLALHRRGVACIRSATRTSTATCAARPSTAPCVDSVRTAVGARLLHGRGRRRRVLVRRRRVPRLDGGHRSCTRRCARSCPIPTARATGSSRSTAACSRSTRRSADRWARRSSTDRSSGWSRSATAT